MTAEYQTERGDEFPESRSCGKKLPHRRVKGRPAKTSVAVAGVGRTVDGQPCLNGGLLACIAL